MSHKVRIWIAATVTALFVAGISVAGLALHDDPPRTLAPVSQPAAPAVDRAAGEAPRLDSDDDDYDDARRDE